MIRKTFFLIGLATIFLIATGCKEIHKSRLELDYGTSKKLATYNQILNPDAEKNLEPVSGLDGQAAKGSIKKYQDDFKKPTKAPQYSISIGKGGGK